MFDDDVLHTPSVLASVGLNERRLRSSLAGLGVLPLWVAFFRFIRSFASEYFLSCSLLLPMVTVGVASRRLYPLVRCRLPTNDCGTALSGVFYLDCIFERTAVLFFTGEYSFEVSAQRPSVLLGMSCGRSPCRRRT